VRRYLDPSRRGNRADECDAIEMFLTDSLAVMTKRVKPDDWVDCSEVAT
jgi:hypothetical protein